MTHLCHRQSIFAVMRNGPVIQQCNLVRSPALMGYVLCIPRAHARACVHVLGGIAKMKRAARAAWAKQTAKAQVVRPAGLMH